MYDFDHNLFLALNFDGGEVTDKIMLAISGTTLWLPLYALIIYLIWRKYGITSTLAFIILMVGAIALSDMVAGIFKHNGLLGSLLPDFTPRARPMFTASLEGLDIPLDSLRTLRRGDLLSNPIVHVPVEAVSGKYGTVSAHAATIVTLALLSAKAIRRCWFNLVVIAATLIICYSRIYLGKHFPMDLVWGTLVGLLLGYAAYYLFREFDNRWGAARK